MEQRENQTAWPDPGASGQWLSFGTASAVRASAQSKSLAEATAIRAQLRASLTGYVRRLAAEGLPAERMLVLVKRAVRDALPSQADPDQARLLLEDVVRWSIEAYFDGT
jgi:hypothetical protein